jgi:hypothetical protein
MQVVAVTVLLAISPLYETVAEGAALETVPVRFGMLFNGTDPVARDVTCQLERPCVLLDNKQPASAYPSNSRGRTAICWNNLMSAVGKPNAPSPPTSHPSSLGVVASSISSKAPTAGWRRLLS